MGFFDLNIPYLEDSASNKSAHKTTRLKLCAKLMELGYTGVAYNRTIRGVMSESDYCSLSLIPIPSFVKFLPSLSASVNFHRHLLGLSPSSPFRQYRRLTVSVDTLSQASALNSGNPILKTYDLVAAKPLSQIAFEQACKVSEVDIIAIDFSERLPFRLKHPVIKTAIKRDVYFEITYGDLVGNVQTRRQVISNAKLLVDWTRGNNLIFSSAASSVNELRGPCDVANLLCLLGLSMGRAKAALSKNCRSLIDNALRKKHYYKEAIKIEPIPSAEQSDSKEPSFCDWLEWDPISSGEGDLLLDEMVKLFSASSNVSKNVKAIDFALIVDSSQSLGLQVKDRISGTSALSQPCKNDENILATSVQSDMSAASNRVSSHSYNLRPQRKRYVTSLFNTSSNLQASGCEDYTGSEKTAAATTDISTDSNGLAFHLSSAGPELNDMQCISSGGATVIPPEDNVTVPRSLKNIEVDTGCDAEVVATTHSREGNILAVQNDEPTKTEACDVCVGAQNVTMEGVLIDIDKVDQPGLLLTPNDAPLPENPLEIDQSREGRDDDVVLQNEAVLFVESCNAMKSITDSSVVNHEVPQMPNTKDNNPLSEKSISGRGRLKRKAHYQTLVFPFKRLMNPVPLKKRARTLKTKLMRG